MSWTLGLSMAPVLTSSSRLCLGVGVEAAPKESFVSETSKDGTIEISWIDLTPALVLPMDSFLSPYVLTLVLVLLLPS